MLICECLVLYKKSQTWHSDVSDGNTMVFWYTQCYCVIAIIVFINISSSLLFLELHFLFYVLVILLWALVFFF